MIILLFTSSHNISYIKKHVKINRHLNFLKYWNKAHRKEHVQKWD